MSVRAIVRWLCFSIGAGLSASSTAFAAAPHTVLPGETLWSISAANNLTTRTVAVYNGLPDTAQLLVGTTIYVPTVAEGAAQHSRAVKRRHFEIALGSAGETFAALDVAAALGLEGANALPLARRLGALIGGLSRACR